MVAQESAARLSLPPLSELNEQERSRMSIQWFPGHMHLTRKAITERIKDIDVVIEVLDARLPGSSANPLLAELTGGRPSLKVLNKQDVADPALTKGARDRAGSVGELGCRRPARAARALSVCWVACSPQRQPALFAVL